MVLDHLHKNTSLISFNAAGIRVHVTIFWCIYCKYIVMKLEINIKNEYY